MRSLLTPGWGQMNIDDKNKNEEKTLMKTQNAWLSGRCLSLQPQEAEEHLEEWIFQAKLSFLFVLNIIIYTYAGTHV